nr:rhamnan synthesis F family protein [Prosthecochloris ethylica]
MRELKLPTVSLLHEFASYTLPRTAFPEAIEHADTIIFSTSVTLNNAIDITGIGYSPKIRILPQGKCKVPCKPGDSGPDRIERDRLEALLKPKGHGQEILVIGVGSVQVRKGTDLFIEVARRVMAQPGGEHFRFFWFGEGYNPDEDPAYSVYLQDQLKRSGIEDRVIIQPVTSEIEYVYELADAFLLASRLDPLPNVAIDAMLSGVPMVVFDKASGIPEILCAAGLEEDCVAEYLDTSRMADKLLHVTGKDRDRISAHMQAHARLTFDFAAYAEQIEHQAMETTRQFRARPQAEALIAKDPGFTPGFMYPVSRQPDKDRTRAARVYLEHHALGIHPRRPEPGFNQNVYYAHHDASRMQHGDAYADYLSRGRPEGPWMTPVLQGPVTERSAPNATGQRTALHIHAYYLDGLNDVLSRLKVNRSRPKVFVSVRDSENLLQAKNLLQSYDGESEIRIVTNLGRDIGPFLTEFGPELVRDFEVIGHVHIKKSITLQNEELVGRWTSFVLSNVLGGPKAGAMMDVQLSEFEQVPGLGMTFPADPNILSWNRNRMHAEQLAAKMGLVDLPDAFDFPVGTMFWMRSSALAPFIGLNLGWTDYPSEPLADDGTMLHALERLFGVVPGMKGFETRMTNVPGVNR